MARFASFGALGPLVRDRCGTECPVGGCHYRPLMRWTEDAPTHCPNGHQLGAGRMLVGWAGPRHGTREQGSRTFECLECGAVTRWAPACRWK